MGWDKVIALISCQIILFLWELWFIQRKFDARREFDIKDKKDRMEFISRCTEADKAWKNQLEEDARNFLVGLKKEEVEKQIKPTHKKKK